MPAGSATVAGARYVDSSFGSNAHDTRNDDACTLVDAEAHYEWQGIRIGSNAANLLDKDFLITQDGLTDRGEDRYVIGSLRFRW
jgi:outer membrane cobalamin receptor